MSHIVFIVGSYLPNMSAVGACCFNIAEEMAKQHKVTVICLKSKANQNETEEYRSQSIIRVSYTWWNLRLKIKEKTGSKSKLNNIL